jgi:uncharacterized iron-regulated protein
MKYVARSKGTLWLGEHHNSVRDHQLQLQVIRSLHELRRGVVTTNTAPPPLLAIGLEQVQIKFQPVLDDFRHGKLSLLEMKRAVEWEQRWVWPFEGYEPIFAAARELHIPLVALNVNSEDLALVNQGGFPALPRDRLEQYITDRYVVLRVLVCYLFGLAC